MSDIDPYFDSRFMHQGTTGAEFIYNEFLGRVVATGYRLLSRTTSSPPASPTDFDAYLVPDGAGGDWLGLDGNIAFALNSAWYPIAVKPGMNVFVVDEKTWVTFQTATFSEATAQDGDVVIVPVFETGSWRVRWDCGFGTAGIVTLANDSFLMTPTNMQPGRSYVLRVQQDGVGGHSLTLEAGGWSISGGVALLPISSLANEVTDLIIHGPQAPANIPTVSRIDTDIQTA